MAPYLKMFWTKKTIESAEFVKLFKLCEENRIKLEMLYLEFDLTKQKLKARRGLEEKKEEKTESESNKNPSIFLNPNGDTL